MGVLRLTDGRAISYETRWPWTIEDYLKPINRPGKYAQGCLHPVDAGIVPAGNGQQSQARGSYGAILSVAKPFHL